MVTLHHTRLFSDITEAYAFKITFFIWKWVFLPYIKCIEYWILGQWYSSNMKWKFINGHINHVKLVNAYCFCCRHCNPEAWLHRFCPFMFYHCGVFIHTILMRVFLILRCHCKVDSRKELHAEKTFSQGACDSLREVSFK